jgi:hypothetical protein
LDDSNKFNYIFSLCFKRYDFADALLSLFTLLPFSSFQEKVDDFIKYSYPTFFVSTAICIGRLIGHFIYDFYVNDYDVNIDNMGDIIIVENKYYVVINFLHKISINPSSFYYFENKESSDIQAVKDHMIYWKEMCEEYQRNENIKKIIKLI